MSKKPLTSGQQDILDRLQPHAGKRVLVLTTVYEANVAQAAKDEAIGIGFNVSALRGLAARGLIKVEFIWKGAWVTVPFEEARTLCNGAQLFPDYANAVERLVLSGWVGQAREFWVRVKNGRVECASLRKLSDGRGILRTLPGLDIPT